MTDENIQKKEKFYFLKQVINFQKPSVGHNHITINFNLTAAKTNSVIYCSKLIFNTQLSQVIQAELTFIYRGR